MKKLPIEKIDPRKFDQEFKSESLDELVLTKKSLNKIKKLFDFYNNIKVYCDDYHRHSYGCTYFENPAMAVVVRLVEEVENYLARTDDIKKVIKLKNYSADEKFKDIRTIINEGYRPDSIAGED